jgi:hypothetical protein
MRRYTRHPERRWRIYRRMVGGFVGRHTSCHKRSLSTLPMSDPAVALVTRGGSGAGGASHSILYPDRKTFFTGFFAALNCTHGEAQGTDEDCPRDHQS